MLYVRPPTLSSLRNALWCGIAACAIIAPGAAVASPPAYPSWAVVDPYQQPATPAQTSPTNTNAMTSSSAFDQIFSTLPQNNNDNSASAAPAPSFQSPPLTVKRTVMHLTTQQPEMAATPMTARQLATLAPTEGGDTPGVTAPLIQIPATTATPPAPAAASTPLAVSVPAPAATSVPLAISVPAPSPASTAITTAPATPASDIKPLLPSAEPPPTSIVVAPLPNATTPSIDTLLQGVQPGTAPTEPPPTLSPKSKAIAAKIPSNLDHKKKSTKPIVVQHSKDTSVGDAEPEVKDAPPTPAKNGMDISVERKIQKVDTNYQLEQAYNALISGHSSEAIDLYKEVLSLEPGNKGALFGLATTYHRAGQLDMARPLYAKLLAVDPNNRDGLNNFLVLLADEAPQEALAQMEALEAHNPEFSPIPAQMALIYSTLGDYDKASDKMFRAIQLEPENLTYRYNLAIMLDKQKKYEEAAKLYGEILKAYQRGEVIPGDIVKIQQRLTFISSNRP